MSEEKPKPKLKRKICNNHCACAKKSAKKKGQQNGKGDSPRNISLRFRDNYDQIDWEHQKKA